jgi:hypothetical protein
VREVYVGLKRRRGERGKKKEAGDVRRNLLPTLQERGRPREKTEERQKGKIKKEEQQKTKKKHKQMRRRRRQRGWLE